MITVIDLKIGNINSVSRALKYIGIEHILSSNPVDIDKAEKLIFPGVGSFAEAMKRMRNQGLDSALKQAVLSRKVPILGICLGMQLFASIGEEGGKTEGLDFIKARVAYHRASGLGFRLPHIGWNEVEHNDLEIFDSVPEKSCFYFVHSYEFIPEEQIETGHTNYGVDFVSFVKKNNIIGTQFHLEKSQGVGLKVLSNFCEDKF
ncbi:MAG: imidazole glycerol phosphate synthase subunit HisH [Candidatus Omnitrophica bacterium]|nr:imidazole glycerol phosphate synthase subunit HisH [Candidatus Omnitrophota bacterium]